MTDVRTPSAIDAIAEDHARALFDHSPELRVYLGIPGDDTQLDDYSPAAAARKDELNASTLARLDEAERAGGLDAVDTVTLDAMRERLGIERDLHAAGLDSGVVNVIESPTQTVRDVFDLVPTDTAEDWANNAARLSSVPAALAGYRESVRAAIAGNRPPALRQVSRVIEQAREVAKDGGHFDRFAAKAEAAGDLPASVSADLSRGAAAAKEAYAELADFFAEEVVESARHSDACGEEDYALHSRYFLGSAVDLRDTYSWGLEELARIDAQQKEVARELIGTEDVFAAMRHLDADPARTLTGLDALKEWMQEKADTALRDMADTHFDIPEVMRTIECKVIPDGTGGIYYSGPTDDFSRPGRMWWSVPAGVETFATWQETTTVYHEGVPGHHLQIGQATYLKDSLNTWRRLISGTSGHIEGWALYAERLMADLGYLDDPGDYMGMLDSQRLRAARVCVDIGVHCKLEAPESLGGGTWDADKAWTFLTDNVAMDHSFLAFELDRYLGWPGQAPSYKIGQRLWEQARDEARARAAGEGREFSLKDFHARSLALGSVGLDTMRRALANLD